MLWNYQRSLPAPARAQARSKTIAIYHDMIYHTAPDGYVIALDARSGQLRWETEVVGGGAHISGLIVANDVVISSRARMGARSRRLCRRGQLPPGRGSVGSVRDQKVS
jgi:outer membrane protein assembly factor BamB